MAKVVINSPDKEHVPVPVLICSSFLHKAGGRKFDKLFYAYVRTACMCLTA